MINHTKICTKQLNYRPSHRLSRKKLTFTVLEINHTKIPESRVERPPGGLREVELQEAREPVGHSAEHDRASPGPESATFRALQTEPALADEPEKVRSSSSSSRASTAQSSSSVRASLMQTITLSSFGRLQIRRTEAPTKREDSGFSVVTQP